MVAFLRGKIEGETIVVQAELLLSSDQVELHRWHVALTDEARQEILRWATGAEVLVEAHSHRALDDPVLLSSTDLDGLEEWVPHVRWRIPGVTYVALVYGGDSFDGLVWQHDIGPAEIGEVKLGGEGRWVPTGLSLQRWNLRHSNA
jgi:hypothetical protein